jgi:aminoglycoside/choline kinase family phosphotransferase
MNFEALIDRTRQRFPHYNDTRAEIVPLEKGGSDRKYYRIRFSADYSLILVKYNREKLENDRFVAIANFLEGIGVNAPFIYYHDMEEGLIWMQDLGEEDLWHHRTESWRVRRELYRNAIDQVITLHQTNLNLCLGVGFLPGFDEATYRWEQNYCFENCFGRYFHITPANLERLSRHPAFGDLARSLAKYPPVLIHRDFQSQNIIIWDEQAYLIDFQGMRPGLGAYDLASLLFDPYVSLIESERVELLGYYLERAGAGWSRDEFISVCHKCAIQRLMQALGAYSVIGLLRQKPEFLRFIQPALKLLHKVASAAEDFRFFAQFLTELPDRPLSH